MSTGSVEKLIQELEGAINAILHCQKTQPVDVCQFSDTQQRRLILLTNRLIASFNDILDFMVPLSRGQWASTPPSKQEKLSFPFIHVHTRLQHLAQQLQRIAQGDFGQSVEFLGELSNAINAMTARLASQDMQLVEKHQEIKSLADKIDRLSQENKELAQCAGQPVRESPPMVEVDFARWNESSDFDSVAIIDAEIFTETFCERVANADINTQSLHTAGQCKAVGQCICIGSPADKLCPIHETITTGRPFRSEKRLAETGPDISKDLEVSLFPIKNEEGKVQKVVRVARDVTHQKESQREVHQLAYYDPLTKLPNRTLFMDRLNQAIANANRRQQKLALLYLDLDNFKAVNDTFSHHNGDRLLQQVAQRLKGSLRESDSVARFGGDEFVVFLPEITDEREVVSVVGKILNDLNRPFKLQNSLTRSGASIGIALYPDDGLTAQTLLNHADLAMYAAKKGGKNNYHFFSEEMHRAVQVRAQMESDLAFATQNGEFFLNYQPQFDIRAGTLVGAEALLRWRTVDGRVLEPASFLRIADETGLILPIGDWVLRTACRQLKFWHRKGLPNLRLGVNISHKQLADPGFSDRVETTLVETGVDPERLTLEISERHFTDLDDLLLQRLESLKGMGVKLAVDDFGTGSFPLPGLIQLPIDRLKIDRTVLGRVQSHARSAALVESILAMAQRLDLTALAEGVETDEQLAFLSVKGCEEMQGYYFGKPMQPLEFSSLIDKTLSPTLQ